MLATLIHVACLRWPLEQDFEFGKDCFGLDHSQVRRYTPLARHIVLTMATPWPPSPSALSPPAAARLERALEI